MDCQPLSSFPVDDITLANIEHALGASLTVNDLGEVAVVGAEFTIPKLLEFYSGYDEALVTPMVDNDGYTVPGWVEYPHPIYTRDDIIRALVVEVRKLRGGEPAMTPVEPDEPTPDPTEPDDD